MTTSWSRSLSGWLLCLPALAIIGVFLVGPALVALGLSLTSWNGMSSDVQFVGVDNYVALFEAEAFWVSLRVNILVAILTLSLQMPLGLFLASLLSSRTRSASVYRAILFTPQMLSLAAVGLIWSLVYDPFGGMANRVLGTLGAPTNPNQAWLGDTSTALPALLITSTWFYFGFHMVLYLAGMASIPQDFYDAARLETNSRWALFRYITWPLLREVRLISFVLIMSGAFGHLIGLFSLMTNGGPQGSTEILGLLMTHFAFRGSQYGMASAVSVVIVLIVLVIVAVPTWKIARERLEY